MSGEGEIRSYEYKCSIKLLNIQQQVCSYKTSRAMVLYLELCWSIYTLPIEHQQPRVVLYCMLLIFIQLESMNYIWLSANLMYNLRKNGQRMNWTTPLNTIHCCSTNFFLFHLVSLLLLLFLLVLLLHNKCLYYLIKILLHFAFHSIHHHHSAIHCYCRIHL